MRKKVLSVFLVLAMMLSLLPTAAFAAPTEGEPTATPLTIKVTASNTTEKVKLTIIGATNGNSIYYQVAADTSSVPENNTTIDDLTAWTEYTAAAEGVDIDQASEKFIIAVEVKSVEESGSTTNTVVQTATSSADPDKAAVAAAKAAIEALEAADLTIENTADGLTKEAIKTAITDTVNTAANGVTAEITVEITKAAVNGTEQSTAGTEGTFSISVALSKGDATDTATNANGKITPIEYVADQDAADVAAAKTAIEALEAAALTVENTADGLTKEAIKTAITDTVNTAANGVTAEITVEITKAAVNGTEQSTAGTEGTFSISVALSKGDATDTATNANGKITPIEYVAPKEITVSATTPDKDGKVTGNATISGTIDKGTPVTIDATTDGTSTITGAKSAEITLVKDLMTQLANASETTIATPVGTIVASAAAITAINSDSSTSGKDVVLVIEPKDTITGVDVPVGATIAALDVSFKVDDTAIPVTLKETDKPINITLDIDDTVSAEAKKNNEEILLVYIDDKGKGTNVDAEVDETTGKITFSTSHLSIYAQMTKSTAQDIQVEGVDPSEIKNAIQVETKGTKARFSVSGLDAYNGKHIYFQITNNGEVSGSGSAIVNGAAYATSTIKEGTLNVWIFGSEPTFSEAGNMEGYAIAYNALQGQEVTK